MTEVGAGVTGRVWSVGRLVGMGTAALLRAIELLAGVLPEDALYALAGRLAGAAPLLAERRRLRVRNNLQRLHPEWELARLNLAVRRVFEETARYYVDLALLPSLPAEQIFHERLSLRGLEHLQRELDAGRGVVATSAHLSNPEAVVRAVGAIGARATALVEPLTDPRQRAAAAARRAGAGVEFVEADRAGIARCIERLRGGGLVAVLWDRDIQGGGPCVPFFQRQARFPVGAVDLAIRTDSALLPIWQRRTRGLRFEVECLPPLELLLTGNRALDVRTGLADLAALFEPILYEHCEQWRMFESPWAPCRDTPWDDPRAQRRQSGGSDRSSGGAA